MMKMVIFHSYVSLPEGIAQQKFCWTPVWALHENLSRQLWHRTSSWLSLPNGPNGNRKPRKLRRDRINVESCEIPTKCWGLNHLWHLNTVRKPYGHISLKTSHAGTEAKARRCDPKRPETRLHYMSNPFQTSPSYSSRRIGTAGKWHRALSLASHRASV